MQTYIGTKTINAKPMTRAEYNIYRDWELPSNENGDDEGYLVEYVDGGTANHPDHSGYISWSPKDVFDRTYKIAETSADRLRIQIQELVEKMDEIELMSASKVEVLKGSQDKVNELIKIQKECMVQYLRSLLMVLGAIESYDDRHHLAMLILLSSRSA